jgi:hypothetical protein
MMVNDRDRRAADETTQPGTCSSLDTAVLNAWRALFDLQLEWASRASAITASDPPAAATAAAVLVAAWQAARKACRAVAEALETAREHECRARMDLNKHGHAIQGLLRGAMEQCALTPEHDDLAQLITELDPLGDGGALSDSHCTRDGRPEGDMTEARGDQL